MEGWQLLESTQCLPKSLTIDLANPQVVQSSELRSDISERIWHYNATFKHFFQDNVGSIYLLERYGAKYCVYWPVSVCDPSDLRQPSGQESKTESNLESKNWSTLHFEDMLALWSENPEERSLSAPIKLNLQLSDSSIRYSKRDHKVLPQEYLETKYYESLFYIHLPLAYFLKSNLERLKGLCKSSSAEESSKAYRTCLSRILLENKHFDRRHEDDNILRDDLYSAIATSKRHSLLEKFSVMGQTETDKRDKNDLCTILRVREIRLQIILLLESIHVDKLDAGFKDFEAKYNRRLKARSLNLTRLIPRRCREERSPRSTQEPEKELNCCEQLDLYLDKLCILDVLLASEPVNANTVTNPIQEHKRNMLSRNKEASSVGFTNFVLIPYFSGKTPYAIRFIIGKLKGPNLRKRNQSHRKDSSAEIAQSSASQTIQSSIPIASPSLHPQLSSGPPSPSESRSSIGNQPIRGLPADLRDLRSNSSLDDRLESATTNRRHPSFISRTSSDITMNHLQRRQLSVTEFTPERPASGSKDGVKPRSSLFDAPFSSQQSFRRVGRRRDVPLTSGSASTAAIDSEVNLVQVMGTPLRRDQTPAKKRAKLHNIVESPMSSLCGDAKIEATPEQKVSSEKTTTRPEAANRRVRRKLFAP